MKRILSIILAIGAGPGLGRAAETPAYSLGTPSAPILQVSFADAPAANEWLASNTAYSVAANLWSAGDLSDAATSAPTVADAEVVALTGVATGFAVERVKPEVYLGDELEAPLDVDWTKTYETYGQSADEQRNFIFDAKNERVYAQAGGNHEFTWTLKSGEEQKRTYVVSSVCSGRPCRLFWTDSPYNAPPVSLSGRFIKLFGPQGIIEPTYGTTVTDLNGTRVTNDNVIVSGVYLDESSSCLYARGKVTGQFIVAFYDSGAFDTLQRVQVVEVGQPDVNYMTGYIGEKIEPYGMGYGTSGLTPSPVTATMTSSDASGEYYYQHKGAFSYSPKNGWIFPLRPTVGEAWRLDVYWMETDAHGISWPFERCNYSCTWNTNKMTTLIANAPVKLPSSCDVTLCGYQEPEGHARAPSGQIFKTSAEGFSMLKVAGDDNVWFVPVRTIDRANTNFFTLAETDWFVGEELRPRGGSVSGTAGGYDPKIDDSVPGLLNLANSGSNYNPDLYYDWTTTSNELASVIYGVNEALTGDPLEVWWSTTVQQDGMSEAIAFPSLAQRYRIKWPAATQVPQIVIASQLGGAGASAYETGACAHFDGADASLALPNAYLFHKTGGSISFWANAKSLRADGRVLTLGGGDDSGFSVSARRAGSGVRYALRIGTDELVAPAVSTDAWHKLVFSFAASNATAFVDGRLAATQTLARATFDGFLEDNALGKGASGAADGLCIDDLAIWAKTFDEAEASNTVYATLASLDADALNTVTFAFDFEGDDDLIPDFGSATRRATELKTQRAHLAANMLRETPGAPVVGDGVFESDTTPVVYRQPVRGQPGYNPNEEHAYIASGAGGYYAWAVRCDLNEATTSKPFVLAQYEKDGAAKMKCFSVLLTNETWTALAGNVDAGHILPGPHPLDLFDTPWCPKTYWDDVPGQPFTSAYRDRKGQVWARAAGTIPIRMFYRNQDGFDYPQLTTAPAVNAEIPWLSELGQTPRATMLDEAPALWTWRVAWPSGVPTMRIGQTLTTTADGLPEVWSAKSVAVLWPQGDDGARARLWDPTVARETGLAGYDTPTAMLAHFGFSVDAGNVTLRAGKFTFKDLPPFIGNRFYVDNSKPVTNCVTYVGELETNAGGNVLWPNVANLEEINALRGLVSDDAAQSVKDEWSHLIYTLELSVPVLPTSVENARNPVATYAPRDHYALTAMGDVGYVTIIENDAPVGSGVGQLGVQDGDAISMHVFAVTNRYYTGRLLAREDPANLLSQQLTILYSESFAGTADAYEFEWKKATPTASGQMPKDYTNAYARVYSTSDEMRGRTRFTLGTQGDTLANLVNTYYVMRYRAVSGLAFETMGDAWSDWCGPTLAEGWVQRVVNNVTPFTQRMTDLYENQAETTATMLQAAGAPYMGDVALNQDNLTSVGLIQLYQTLLNKAESMSIASGSGVGVNDAEVNKQLLLATERLADMYTVLGNDAYSDAINPTIGYGSSFDTAFSATSYGATSAAEVFCFDNQVASLLDEELALLRGRTGANNPSVETAPCYNRLVWNFTRGITAGEVAYAVNYNINSTDGDASIDEDDAALQYPQGHGDAWGHYLSALASYYRLLRNPYFTWPVSQSQMLVADAVVDVDYYDEERFAEIADKLATTADAIVTRTALKAWRDNGGADGAADGAGYLDDDAGRNFGYGEWATRGAIAGVANWMVANAILPEAESSDVHYRLLFDGDTTLSCTNIPLSAKTMAETGWTFEFQVASPTNAAHVGAGALLSLVGVAPDDEIQVGVPDEIDEDTPGVTVRLALASNGDGTGRLEAYDTLAYLQLVTNAFDVVTTNGSGVVETNVAQSVSYETKTKILEDTRQTATFAIPDDALFAIAQSPSGDVGLRVLDADGSVVANVRSTRALRFGTSVDAVFGGDGFAGFVSEIRGWLTATRTDAELQSARSYVNSRETSLAFCTRGISSRTTDVTLADETPGGDVLWEVQNPEWVEAAESGLSLKFSDDGLVRIDRTTVSALETIPTSVENIQRTLDRLDAGLNPLGLSDDAVPFDISSAGVAEGTSTHFEQIAARAETALQNANKLLQRAQYASSYLRRLQNSAAQEEEDAQVSETDYDSQLVAIYGKPFSGDIGPGKLYEQGYDGPDLYHYMYMDLTGYGLSSIDDLDGKYVIAYDTTSKKWSYATMKTYVKSGYTKNAASNALHVVVSANGLIVADTATMGTRTVYGEIQDAYSDYLLAYVDAKNAVSSYNKSIELLSKTYDYVAAHLSDEQSLFHAAKALHSEKLANNAVTAYLNNMSRTLTTIASATRQGAEVAIKASPSVVGAGFTVVASPKSAVEALVGNTADVTVSAVNSAVLQIAGVKEALSYANTIFETAYNFSADFARWTAAESSAWSSLCSAVSSANSAAATAKTAITKLNSLSSNFDAIVAKGDRLLKEREAARARRVNRITKIRYNDMLFRNLRDAALARYETAFETAQRQVYLAAQVYDYETGLLSSDPDSGAAFKAEIVGARALGPIDATTGEPEIGSGTGDAGLADVLARLKANYAVLKGRLGINNAQGNVTSFSLRRDLFEIDMTSAGDADWRKELSKYRVENLLENDEFNRYCQPFASTSGLNAREPALVIPFSSTIDFGKNFFGKTLKAGGSALPSSYYATKIRSASVRFEGYNKSVGASATAALAATPSVYLVPVGVDRMRAPDDATGGTVLEYSVVDQVIPVPYAIGSTELDKIDFSALTSGYAGTGEPGARIRRYPSFRAMTGADDDAARTSTRLIGRSAWNTRWLLVVPAGEMLGGSVEDREKALDIFIDGLDADRDGTLDVSPVTDIVINLDTYSHSGN